jgi:uncharacterized protein YyaL (SSP411 family)
MRRIVLVSLFVFGVASNSQAQKKVWHDRLIATRAYLQNHFWNPQSGNFIRRADQPGAPGSDAWGITIMLDGMVYMIPEGLIQPSGLKQYFQASTGLYSKTDGNSGARVLARQGNQIYVGGDDDLQWCAALVHCYEVTKDSDYLNAAKSSFNALVNMDFWQNGTSKGWSWNSNDRRPNGVSTAYGALTAARLYRVTHEAVYRQWVLASLIALHTPQVGFFPRDMMVAADAALTVYEVSKEDSFRDRAMELEDSAVAGGLALLHHDGTGERNPTDIGDLADGLFHFYTVTHQAKYKVLAEKFIEFFADHRTLDDISAHGFYSRYDLKGKPVLQGAYIGVPCNVQFLPEVAEMLKLFAIAEKEQ